LTKLARPVLHVVLTKGFVQSYRKQWFGRIDRGLHSAPALNIQRMAILAG
jgi:hypothetical protein